MTYKRKQTPCSNERLMYKLALFKASLKKSTWYFLT
jgi:hypothetical protein